MKRTLKQGLFALTIGLTVTASAVPSLAATTVETTAQPHTEIARIIEQKSEVNCLQLFASIYLEELKKIHAKEVAAAEIRALAAEQLQTHQVAVAVNDTVAAAPTPKPAAATPKPAVKKTQATPKPAVKAPAKAPAKTPAKTSDTASKTVVTTAGKSMPYKKVISMKATAYSGDASENGGWAGLDYFGNSLKLGTVAVDPNIIPLGSTVYITGYSASGLPVKGMMGKATDVGGAIKGNRIDIYIPGSNQLVQSFGIQNVQVYVM